MKSNKKDVKFIKYMRLIGEVLMENDIAEIGPRKAAKIWVDKLHEEGLADNKEEAKQWADNYFDGKEITEG